MRQSPANFGKAVAPWVPALIPADFCRAGRKARTGSGHRCSGPVISSAIHRRTAARMLCGHGFFQAGQTAFFRRDQRVVGAAPGTRSQAGALSRSHARRAGRMAPSPKGASLMCEGTAMPRLALPCIVHCDPPCVVWEGRGHSSVRGPVAGVPGRRPCRCAPTTPSATGRLQAREDALERRDGTKECSHGHPTRSSVSDHARPAGRARRRAGARARRAHRPRAAAEREVGRTPVAPR